MKWITKTSRGPYYQYFVEGLKVHEKTLVAVIMPPLRKMHFSNRAIV